jgi:uncharacterized surface protein with fasciclin (FAS1) repeats
MKKQFYSLKQITLITAFGFLSHLSVAQTNVFDDVIASSPNHTSLEAALIAADLDDDLQNPSGTFTVFAPDDAAFSVLATELGTTVPGLLASPYLSDILLYHVLGITVGSSAVTNGAVVNPLNTANSLKLTKTATNTVFVNHASVTAADVQADNGVVHVINHVLLPVETVIDVALDNGFTTLATALVQEELIPVLSNPFAQFTAFAPSNSAFDSLATALNTTVSGLLALPNLSNVLKYHVLGTEVLSVAITNGAVVNPLNTANSLKLTKTTTNTVFVNHASVTAADVQADNGVVHVINRVLLPVETVIDVALDNGFSTLATALVQEELIPVLSNPFAQFTVFAPTNTAFAELATELGTNLAGVLSLPNLTGILTYHVLPLEALSTNLVDGPVTTVEGSNVIISTLPSVKVNDANVVTADVQADNGVVHVIDKVIFDSYLGLATNNFNQVNCFPNPSSDAIRIEGLNDAGTFTIYNQIGELIKTGGVSNGIIQISDLSEGIYTIQINQNSSVFKTRLVKI